MGINYDREEINETNKSEKKTLTTAEKIDFIAHCDIRKTREELIAYRKELTTRPIEEINLMYTKLNKEYWKNVEAYLNYRRNQNHKHTDREEEQIEETDGLIL